MRFLLYSIVFVAIVVYNVFGVEDLVDRLRKSEERLISYVKNNSKAGRDPYRFNNKTLEVNQIVDFVRLQAVRANQLEVQWTFTSEVTYTNDVYWKPEEFDGIRVVETDENIWSPDFDGCQLQSVAIKDKSMSKFMVFYNGTVKRKFNADISSRCEMNFTRMPNDNHNCLFCVQLSSWANSIKYNLSFIDNLVIQSDSNWKMTNKTDIQTFNETMGGVKSIKQKAIFFSFERVPTTFELVVILPVTLLLVGAAVQMAKTNEPMEVFIETGCGLTFATGVLLQFLPTQSTVAEIAIILVVGFCVIFLIALVQMLIISITLTLDQLTVLKADEKRKKDDDADINTSAIENSPQQMNPVEGETMRKASLGSNQHPEAGLQIDGPQYVEYWNPSFQDDTEERFTTVISIRNKRASM